MIRVNFHLTDDQRALLQKQSQDSGVPMAEYVRRAIDAALKRDGK